MLYLLIFMVLKIGFLECQEMSGSYFFLNSFKKEKINLPSTFEILHLLFWLQIIIFITII